MEWLLFVLGIPTAIGTAYVYDILKTMAKAQSQKLRIEGSWGEFVKDSKGHQYSLGRIRYDKRRGFWAFDGTNFHNNGDPFCHWETVASYVDISDRKYYYTFSSRLENEFDRSYFGFGVVNLTLNDRGQLVPIDGHYVSANVDGRGMSHSMIPTALKYGRGMDGGQVLEMIKAQTPRARGRLAGKEVRALVASQ